MPEKDTTRVTVNLPNEDILRMNEQARKRATTKTAALVRAIRTAQFIDDQEAKGGEVYVKDDDGTFRQVVFK